MDLSYIINSIYFYGAKFFNRIIVAVIYILVGLIMGRLAEKLVFKILNEFKIRHVLNKFKIKIFSERFISRIIKFIIYLIAIIFVLNALNITKIVLWGVIIIFVVLSALSFLFGAKDFIKNILAGIKIKHNDKIKIGQNLKVGDVHGKVVEMSSIDIKVETPNKDIISIPNSMIN